MVVWRTPTDTSSKNIHRTQQEDIYSYNISKILFRIKLNHINDNNYNYMDIFQLNQNLYIQIIKFDLRL